MSKKKKGVPVVCFFWDCFRVINVEAQAAHCRMTNASTMIAYLAHVSTFLEVGCYLPLPATESKCGGNNTSSIEFLFCMHTKLGGRTHRLLQKKVKIHSHFRPRRNRLKCLVGYVGVSPKYQKRLEDRVRDLQARCFDTCRSRGGV